MIRQNRLFWSCLVALCLTFSLLLVWQKSASATHNCFERTGPFGGRGINCTYYINGPVHPNVGELFNQGSWNWPLGYYNEGLVPNGANNNAEAFINWNRNVLWGCGFHPIGPGSCPGAPGPVRNDYWGRRVGTSFIINTMLGQPGSRFEAGGAPPYNNYGVGGIAYAQDNFNTWANLIRQYEAAGLITWSQYLTHAQVANIPGGQCGGAGGRSDTVVFDLGAFGMDQAIYNNTYCDASYYMTFRHPTTNQPIYRINRMCGNVTGNMAALPPIPAHGFNATPTAGVSAAPDIERPASATFNSGVYYSGAPFQGQLFWNYFIVRAGTTVEQRIATGNTPPMTFTGGSFNNPPATIDVTGLNLQPGDQICNRTRINPAAGNAAPNGAIIGTPTIPTRATEPPFCITIVNRPYYRAYGDMQAGAGFLTGGMCRTNNTARFIGFNRGSPPYTGAGTQLAALAMGQIEGFTTGQWRNLNAPKSLTFANTGGGAAGSTYGGGLINTNYLACAPDYYGTGFGTATTNLGNNATINPGDTPGPNNIVRASGNVTIAGRTLGAGQDQTIYVDGNAFITGSVNFLGGAPSYGNQTLIPSFRLIVRGNIYVDPSVTRLDGIYIAQPRDVNGDGDLTDVNAGNPQSGDAQGRFYTCGRRSWTGRPDAPDFAPNDTDLAGVCRTNRLSVVGAVTAETIKLLRSRGTQAASTVLEHYNGAGGDAAEIFIFSPEVWMGGDLPGAGGEFDAMTVLPPVL